MEGQFKPKVTGRSFDRPRPASPFKPTTTSLSPPPIRPKAKVNSSATIQTRKPASIVSTASSIRNIPPPNRAPSPFKHAQIRPPNAPEARGTAVRSRLTARTNGNNSTSPLPESRQRALTSGLPSSPAPLIRPPPLTRPRRGSASSNLLSSPMHSEIDSASSPARSSLTLSSHPDENTPAHSSATNVGIRVKAKLSRVAEPGVHGSPSLPVSPLLGNRPARVPSISNLSLSPPLMPNSTGHSPASAVFSPLTPLSARFGSAREARHQSFQPSSKVSHVFVPNDDLAVDYGRSHRIAAKVDPTSIPLPPQSPPTSMLSFSSRSSASRSSLSYDTHDSNVSRSTAPTLHSNVNGNGHARQASQSSQARASLESLGIRTEPVSREPSSTSEVEFSDDLDSDVRPHTDDGADEERKLRAEAKTNRKIADLEITNRSLLAINTTLEATKHRQAKEIRELRRKLRESRLILPPPAYRAVKSSLPPDEIADEEDDEDDDDEEEDDAELIEGKADEAYRRVKSMIDSLLDSGRSALESKPDDFVGSVKGVAKVLTEEEVRTWRGDDNDVETRSTLDADVDLSSVTSSRPLTPSKVAVPNSDDGLESEDEVEASLLEPDMTPPAPLPPITITPST